MLSHFTIDVVSVFQHEQIGFLRAGKQGKHKEEENAETLKHGGKCREVNIMKNDKSQLAKVLKTAFVFC